MRIFCFNSTNYLIMKKILCVIVLLVLVCAGALMLPKEQKVDYLRLHIRANSNTMIDQNVKYKIKDLMVDFLTPMLCNVSSKDAAIGIINKNKTELICKCKNLLRENGFNYSVNIKINNEYFPTRTYSNTTLQSGYYDAVIVELGKAEGDNWWCVMYPPLCFVNKFENNMQIKYKSKIVEWFNELFN